MHGQNPVERDRSSTLVIETTNFTQNLALINGTRSARIEGSDSGWGGALFVGDQRAVTDEGEFSISKGGSSCSLTSVKFEENKSGSGGAVAAILATQLSMDNVEFVGNVAGQGGALNFHSEGDKDPRLFASPDHYANGTGTIFSNNTAMYGGALLVHVSTGTASLERAGISPKEVSLVNTDRDNNNNNEDDVFFENAVFADNKGQFSGGALTAQRGRVGCRNCVFSANTVKPPVGSGGFGGAVRLIDQSVFHGRNVSFQGNRASFGGGISSKDSIVDIIKGNFSDNSAIDGGGVHSSVAPDVSFKFKLVARLEQCDFFRNDAEVGGKEKALKSFRMQFRCILHISAPCCGMASRLAVEQPANRTLVDSPSASYCVGNDCSAQKKTQKIQILQIWLGLTQISTFCEKLNTKICTLQGRNSP